MTLQTVRRHRFHWGLEPNGSVVGAHQIPLEGGHAAFFVQIGLAGDCGLNVAASID